MHYTNFTLQSFVRLITVLFFVTLASGLFAQASLSIQGVLTKSDGTAVDDGIYTVTFKLFDAATGGNEVHSEPIDIETVGGVYSTILGQNSSYPLNATFGTIYYLSVRVGSTELLPRPQLTHAPYALSLLGQSNQFPSTGRVNADYIVVPGGEPAPGIANKGYSFGTGGDPDGGMFSAGDNNVSLWANGTKKIEMSNTVNNLFGSTVNYGALTSNNLTVNGNEVVTGTITSGKHFSSMAVNGGGYAFQGDDDSGLFGTQDGETELRSNGNTRLLVGANGTTYLNGNFILQNGVTIQGSNVFAELTNVPNGNNSHVVRRMNGTNQLVVETSSRRYKHNIRPFSDDFTKILKTQPRIYDRNNNPLPANELGYIAEEIDSLGMDRAVIIDTLGRPDDINYDKLLIYAVEVLKMQNADIEQLKTELAALKAENAGLRSENNTLRTENTAAQQQQSAFSARLDELSERLKKMENSGGQGLRK